VLCYGEWWDCPRSGLTRVDGVIMHFASPFDDTVDDYVTAFYLWAATEQEVVDALDFWQVIAAWKARVDAGEQPPVFPPVGETDTQRRRQQLTQQGPPATALRAVPQWRLDRNRSFVGRVPHHKVRWAFLANADR
jgi:hypothetical protein